ncbi:hypothetical protein GJA_996 [Janthinobacterium agaricidamnosum NBRC 102515 = DSM 9628]|uniref:Uncharacterized protein n=1 Tax=Janthinobacterium agaricidamnosum NBRC 102515 = DSM 9628 TaxID=1349767 RepID=W0V1A0_9BURK|nr:hypothetical protein GJA_996 [Janthinobacterium agaricidamnosum NBRC 102515 = DSM 9628]
MAWRIYQHISSRNLTNHHDSDSIINFANHYIINKNILIK